MRSVSFSLCCTSERPSCRADTAVSAISTPVVVEKRTEVNTTQPFAILAEWVEGYTHSVSSRYNHDTLVPSWIDLMLWAVLTGEDQLVQPLWAKTRDPLRAALLASKACQRLSGLPHLRSDERHLKQLAVEYEDWAIGRWGRIPRKFQ